MEFLTGPDICIHIKTQSTMGLFVHLGTLIKIDENDDINEVKSPNKVMFVIGSSFNKIPS